MSDLKIRVREGDVIIDKDAAIPSIEFSSRIKDLIIQDMKLAVVVKLLGRTIGYKTFYDKILNLWKPTGPFQLVDLEGDCFIVKFQNDMDFHTALLDARWTLGYLRALPYSATLGPIFFHLKL